MSSFNSNGKVTLTGVAGATCIKLQTNGKIVVSCGSVVVRLMPDGSMDYSFGTGGFATLTHYFNGMAIQNDGKILLAGGNNEFVVQRLDTLGSVDNSFGNGGVVITLRCFNNSYYSPVARWVLQQADGRILAGGSARYGTNADYGDFAIARYNSNGTPDTSFGQNMPGLYGTTAPQVLPPYYSTKSFSAAIINNISLVVAGFAYEGGIPASSGWALASYNLGPLLGVPTVPGVNTQITVAPNPAEDFARVQCAHIENGAWHLSLYDLTGKLLNSEMVVITNNSLDKRISLLTLPPAIYLVKLDNGISTTTAKLTKNR